MPRRNTNLSFVPNSRIAHSRKPVGVWSMITLPTASMGEITSVMPATSRPTPIASPPASKPASDANARFG
jgi:hypothetical protein